MAQPQLWGRHVLQELELAVQFFDAFLPIARPSGILELGTGSGGWSVYLWAGARFLENDCRLMSVDKDDHPVLKRFAATVPGLEFLTGRFTDAAVMLRMRAFIAAHRPRVFLCDGGEKDAAGEIVDTKLSQVQFAMAEAQAGDFVLSHDFGKPQFLGITDSVLTDLEKAHGFERRFAEVSEPAMWSCSIKVNA